VSGKAFKLGDIIRYRNGKTVEVDNTDAEGRLVLADGLISADSDKPHYIIDCATLTGAAKIAVGNDYQSLLSFDDLFANQLLASSQAEHAFGGYVNNFINDIHSFNDFTKNSITILDW